MKRKGRRSLEELLTMPLYKRNPLQAQDHFSGEEASIIAEFKRRSPSKGMMNSSADPVSVVKSYKLGGASAVSILTDRDFFGGSFKDLERAKKEVGDIPMLRKDFMIDPYQVYEAKAYGADIILLIAAVLSKEECRELSNLAFDLGLSVLLEVHCEEEIDHWIPGIGLIGVNNRDLKTFQTSIQRSLDLYSLLPAESIKVSESGLHNAGEVRRLFDVGYQAFLMGERFMRTTDPGKALGSFVKELRAKQ